MNKIVIELQKQIPFCASKKVYLRVSGMAQWVKLLASEPDDLSSVPGGHVKIG